MGTWSVKIFGNDIAEDVKMEYVELLKEGLSAEDADRQMLESYQEVITLNDNDTADFYLALALIEWQYGRLQEQTKLKALEVASNEEYLEIWLEEGEKEFQKRKQVLQEFCEKIISPQPKIKKVPIIKPFNCIWNIGDVFAYQLKSEESRKRGLLGKYLVFQKVDELSAYPKVVIPVIRISKVIFNEIPSITDFTRSEKVIWSHPGVYYNEQLFYKYDEAFYVKSLKSYPKNLIYLGNNLPIQKEIIEQTFAGYDYSFWKDLEESFFTQLDLWKCLKLQNLLKYNSEEELIEADLAGYQYTILYSTIDVLKDYFDPQERTSKMIRLLLKDLQADCNGLLQIRFIQNLLDFQIINQEVFDKIVIFQKKVINLSLDEDNSTNVEKKVYDICLLAKQIYEQLFYV